jgi:hypothetical protein
MGTPRLPLATLPKKSSDRSNESLPQGGAYPEQGRTDRKSRAALPQGGAYPEQGRTDRKSRAARLQSIQQGLSHDENDSNSDKSPTRPVR